MLFRYPFVAMGSGCELLIEGENVPQTRSVMETALREIHRLEAKYSFYREDSFLSRLNREAHPRGVELDPETARLLAIAAELHAGSQGRFDPTIGALQGCWDFAAMCVPSREVLKRGLEGVGWHLVELNGSRLRLHHPRTRLDLGGLVKEYAVDSAVGVLLALGIRRGIVNLGGDIRLVGSVPAGRRPFQVGVAHPRRHHGLACTLTLREGAVVTSGDYQRYFLRDGRRYHHLLDPRTGYPFALRYSGVSAHAPSAVEAMRRVKIVMFGTPEGAADPAPAEHAYVACGDDGSPVAWQETAACRIGLATSAASPRLAG